MVKTREILVDVARQLFAKGGVENTTMNDIAVASRKGRRTLYTYFKNKNELYRAVIESELQHLLQRLTNVANRELPPEEKLMGYITTRFDAIKETVVRNGSLRAEFFRDIWKVEQVRRNVDMEEIELLKKILQEGISAGVFRMFNVSAAASTLHYSLKGLDVPYIRGCFSDWGVDSGRLKEYITDFIIYGIKK